MKFIAYSCFPAVWENNCILILEKSEKLEDA